MRTPEAIVNLYVQRRRDRVALHQQMAHIQAVYKGDVEIPLPDMGRTEQSSVPNLLQSGVDQMAGRIASVTPEAHFAIEGKGTRTPTRLAETRRRVVTGWWASDQLPIKTKKRARHLIAYSASPATVRYHPKRQRPTWQVRDPLTAYPAPDMQVGEVTPNDIVYSYRRSLAWCRGMGYSVEAILPNAATLDPDTQVTILEYHDIDQTTLIAYAEPGVVNGATWYGALGGAVTLEYIPNPIDLVPCTYPTRISLEDAGQFDGMVGMYYQQAKLMALEIIGVERGLFPDTYLEGRSGEVPRFVAGPYDGRSGEVNIVSGGTIRTESVQPGYMTNQTIDRLERAQRVTSGIPADFGGESPSNVRTGRRGDAVISATIDFPVAEAQDILALALHDEDMAAIKLSRYYDGMAPRTIYVGTGNNRTSTTYISAKVFPENCDHTVTYPITGNDLNALMIGVGQRVGIGTMSKKSGAELDPYIADAEIEHDRITYEGIESALLSSIQQQAATGQIPPLVLSRIMSLVVTDRMELPEAIEKATQEAMEAAQAQQQQDPQAQAAGQAGAQALAGTEMSPIPGASPGQESLSGLMSTLRKPAMTIQPGRGIDRGAV